jgi:hypothetical protein
MSNDAVKTSQLGITTTLANNDRVVVLTNPNTAAQTQTIAVSTLARTLASNIMPIANSTQLGVIKIGAGLSVAANGVVTAPIPVANASIAGVVKIGSGLTVDQDGALNVTGGGGPTNTGYYTFDNNIMSLNTSDEMRIKNPNNAVFVDGTWIAQIAATANAAESGNSQSYVWAYQEPSNNTYIGYAESGVYVQSLETVGNNNIQWAQYVLNPNGAFRYWASNSSGYVPLTINVNDSNQFKFGVSIDQYNPIDTISSPHPLMIRSNGYVTTVFNETPGGFAELWWHNGLPEANDQPVDSDFYVEGDGAWLVNVKKDSSNNYVNNTWQWDMNGIFHIPNNGDIYRNGLSVIGTGQIDGGNAFTTPTAEITVDGGGA